MTLYWKDRKEYHVELEQSICREIYDPSSTISICVEDAPGLTDRNKPEKYAYGETEFLHLLHTCYRMGDILGSLSLPNNRLGIKCMKVLDSFVNIDNILTDNFELMWRD